MVDDDIYVDVTSVSAFLKGWAVRVFLYKVLPALLFVLIMVVFSL